MDDGFSAVVTAVLFVIGIAVWIANFDQFEGDYVSQMVREGEQFCESNDSEVKEFSFHWLGASSVVECENSAKKDIIRKFEKTELSE